MAKDVNIHVKTTGTGQAKSDLDQVTRSTEELGVKSSRSAGWMKEAFSALIGPLGIAGIVTLAVAGIRKIIAAFDDMKKAAAEAMQELANQQRAAASFFETMDAYSGPQRRAALAAARGLQAATGIPQEAAMQILEAQKRTFGEITPKASEQFAAYWAMHAQGATTDLIRWMGESKITDPQRQGQIMRMISAVAKESKLRDEELIGPITARAQRFKYLGWSPEQAITYTGKALAGLSAAESSRVMRGLFESLEGFTEEEARKMKAPPKIAASEQARIEWLQVKVATMTPEQRRTTLKKLYGTMAPYVTKMLFEPTPPEMQKALEYAATPAAAAEEQRRISEFRKTEEAQLEMGKGKAVRPEFGLTPEQTKWVLIREQGKAYLEYLRIADRVKYEKIKAFGLSETAEQEIAARELWQTTQKITYRERREGKGRNIIADILGLPEALPVIPPSWESTPLEERLTGVEQAAQQINVHYHHDTIYNPRVGSDERGPRFTQD